MRHEFILAGFGGQGIMTMGTMLANAGMQEGKYVTWLPSYGAEQRGGTANCTVVVSDDIIASPIVDRPRYLVVMNAPSLIKFEAKAAAGGMIFVNSSLVAARLSRDDVKEFRVPANELAEKIGNVKVANTIMLGALVAASGVVTFETLARLLGESLKGRGKELLPLNLEAIEAGRRAASS